MYGLASLLVPKESKDRHPYELTEAFAQSALQFLKERNIKELIEVIRQLNLIDEFQSIKHQKFAEYCLHEVLCILHKEPVTSAFYCFMWNILNVIHTSSIVRRTVWKDSTVVPALTQALLHSTKYKNKKLQKVCASFLSSLLVGAPVMFFQQIGELHIIKSLVDIINNDEYMEETLQSVICCIGLLCDGTNTCKQQLIDLKVAEVVLQMGEKHALLDENFCHLAAMTYDDLSVLKIDGSIGRQKFLKTQIDDILYCSNSICLKQQKGTKFKKCSQCKLTFYCCKECQVEHWKNVHYRFCIKD